MKLKAAKLKAEADAHAARMQSELWATPDGEKDEDWTAPLSSGSAITDSPPRALPAARRSSKEDATTTREPHLDELSRNVKQLTDELNRRPVGSEDMPGWLLAAAGNPHAHDTPVSTRRSGCARAAGHLRSDQRSPATAAAPYHGGNLGVSAGAGPRGGRIAAKLIIGAATPQRLSNSR